MSSKTTINWLFNDIWCYLFTACFDWKIVVFQKTFVRVYYILNLQQWHLITTKKRKEHAKRKFWKLLMVHLHRQFFFSIYGSMVKKYQRFYSRLPDLSKEKRDLPKLIIITQIYTKLCLVLLKFNLLCSRGFQITYRKIAEFECEIKDLHNIYY